MGDRDPRISWNCHRGSDPRNHFKRDSFPEQEFQFLSASSEYKGISALQSEHAFSFLRLPHKDPVDLILGHRMTAGMLAHVDRLRCRRDTA